MNNKSKYAMIAIIIVVIAVISFFVLSEQYNKGDNANVETVEETRPQLEDVADKVPLQKESDQVLKRLTYCQRAIEKKHGKISKEKGFEKLWQGVNEIHAMAYAARMKEEDVTAASQRLDKYSKKVDKLYSKYSKTIKKLKKKDAKEKVNK